MTQSDLIRDQVVYQSGHDYCVLLRYNSVMEAASDQFAPEEMLLSATSDLILQFFSAEELNRAYVQRLGRAHEITALLNWLACLDHEHGDLRVGI